MRVARNRTACLPSPRHNLTAIRPLPYRTLVDASSLTNEAVADMLASTIAKLPEVHVGTLTAAFLFANGRVGKWLHASRTQCTTVRRGRRDGLLHGIDGIALQNSIAQLVLANMDEAVRTFLSALSPTACTGASSDTIALFSTAAIDTALEKVRSRTVRCTSHLSHCHPCALPSAE